MWQGIYETSAAGKRDWASTQLARYPKKLAETIAADLVRAVALGPVGGGVGGQQWVPPAHLYKHVFPAGLARAVSRTVTRSTTWQL